MDVEIYDVVYTRPTGLRRARLYAIHALDVVWTKITWPIARFLDDRTPACWARLAMWSLFRGSEFPSLDKPEDCAGEIETLGSCWCGKYKDEARMMEILQERMNER